MDAQALVLMLQVYPVKEGGSYTLGGFRYSRVTIFTNFTEHALSNQKFAKFIQTCLGFGLHAVEIEVFQVGMAALAIAKQSGASKVVVIGGPAHRLEAALAWGADAVVSVVPSLKPIPCVSRRRWKALATSPSSPGAMRESISTMVTREPSRRGR